MRRFVCTAVCSAFVALLHFAAVLPATAAATIGVPAQQPTIQDGINAAASGDTVLVAPGTYFENINFKGKAITVTSSGGPNVTIIDGDDSGVVVTFATSETLKSVLSGFTIRNASTSGIEVSSSSPTIKGNIISGNSTCGGSGIVIDGGSPSISGNLISENGSSACFYYNYAGIVSSDDTGVQITGNVISGNSGPGISLYPVSGSEMIVQNAVTNNAGDGFFVYGQNGSSATLIQNLITGNSGTGVSWVNPPVTMVSNTITGNGYAPGCCGTTGSEISGSLIDSAVILENNLAVATGSAPAFFCNSVSSSPTITNNDVFSVNNSAYSDACPAETGASENLSVDPIFVDALSENFHLQSTSPAIKAGTISAADEPKTDFDGDPRIIAGAIDIGADEYTSTPTLASSAYALHFAPQDASTTSATQSVTLNNNGKTAVQLSLIATGSNYSQTNNCGSSLAAGASCKIAVAFAPLAGGIIDSALGIFSSATLNPIAVSLVGTGLAPQSQIGCCFYFFDQKIYTTVTNTTSISNTGQAPLLINSIIYTGAADFTESNNCPVAPNSLAVGASCTLTVSFTPTIVGSESGTITVTSNAGPAQIVNISGSSVSAGSPVFAPTTLTFPPTLIGQGSAPQTLTLTNAGTGALGITGISAYDSFQETNNCPASLAVNASCTLSIIFVPSAPGTASGFLEVFTDSTSFVLEAGFTGTGESPVPTVTSLSLPDVPSDSPNINVTVTGTGFVYGSQVLMDGIPVGGYNYVSATSQLSFTVPAATPAGIYQISVYNPAPGGGTSNSLPFTVYNAVNYAEKPTTYSYDTITGTNLGITYNGEAVITSPFPIQFGGGSFTSLTIGAGGTISFGSYFNYYNGSIPVSGIATLIAPFWTNLYPFGPSTGTNNSVFWEVTGTAPNRALVVEWRNVAYCCETTNTVRFEVIFHEGSGNILFNYENTLFGGSYSADNNGATATDGIQVTPNVATQFSYDQPLILSKTSQLWYPSSPTPSLSASTLAFGYHQLDIPSLPQKVTLTNGSIATLAISSITTNNPDFAATSTCGATLASGASCVVTVIFTPSLPSAETATLTIADDATNAPQTVSLTGIGSITSTVVYPILVNFGSVAVGSMGTAPVTLANASNTRMTIQSITTNPSVYGDSNNCGTSLAPGSSCTVTVTFKPTVAGSVQGALSMGLESDSVKVEANLTGSGK
jgi:hypothetical protein